MIQPSLPLERVAELALAYQLPGGCQMCPKVMVTLPLVCCWLASQGDGADANGAAGLLLVKVAKQNLPVISLLLSCFHVRLYFHKLTSSVN
jgi:hypothetical protein